MLGAQRKKQTIYQRYLEEEKNVLGVYRREKHECQGPRGRNKQYIRGIWRKKKMFQGYIEEKNMNVRGPEEETNNVSEVFGGRKNVLVYIKT